VAIVNGRGEQVEKIRSGALFNSSFGLKWKIPDIPGGGSIYSFQLSHS
jgi:hypothetical protein